MQSPDFYRPWLDSKGYPVCTGPSPDGGDCAADMGTFMSLNPINEKSIMDSITIPWDGPTEQPLRYWDATKWSGLPNRFSRDQLIPLICGFTNSSPRYLITAGVFYKAHAKRWFLTTWNTLNNDGSAKSFPANLGDICGPEVWALWIRYKNPWWRQLVLWFFDIQTLIGAIQWRWFTPATNQITRNHMHVCLNMLAHSPSPTSYLISWINNWTDLVARWRACNSATGEIPTADMFLAKVPK
jgi:hypothetical protein